MSFGIPPSQVSQSNGPNVKQGTVFPKWYQQQSDVELIDELNLIFNRLIAQGNKIFFF